MSVLLELGLWIAVAFGLGLALWFYKKPPPPRVSRAPSSVRIARVRVDSGRLPRISQFGEDPDMTRIQAGPQLVTGGDGVVDLLEFEELRRSRVQLIYEEQAESDEPTAPSARILMTARGQSDRGRTRAQNEDRLLVAPERSVFVVADGMGGHAGGQVASELAVQTVASAYERRDFQGVVESELTIPRRARDLARAVQMANHAVHERAATTPGLHEMGTTLVVAKFSPRKQRVYIGHVGDSRCYRIRGLGVRQLTTDHNLGSVGVVGPTAGRLVRALGLEASVVIDLIIDRPLPDDVYCLCSDGLSKMLSDEEIGAIVGAHHDLDAAVRSLIHLANERGGRDNVTVVLVRVVESMRQRASA
ncbi:MAG: Protein serine/threonine phosphatase PrpC, regulation of stationary phase [Polyangiaceae bacterium]|jgi:protein phosphatase|nr:Protein serine/threonine phosphatase PrpC, regulation of stationary phase [Polyangiaceae bacterium]